MAKTVRSKTQARKEKSALKKLYDLGIIRKPDLRKSPTKNQREKLKRFADIISAKPVSAKTSGARARKGETLFKTKSGDVIGVRKIGGRVVKSKHRKVAAGEAPPKPEGKSKTQYAIPFIRGRDASGKAILEWKRFPNWEIMQQIMSQHYEPTGYKDWQGYVIEEEFGSKDDGALRAKLEAKMQRRAKQWRKEARAKSTTRNASSKSRAGRARMSKKKGR